MARIRELLHASTHDLSAADIAEQVGISRSTPQRYLAELARQGKIELTSTTALLVALSIATGWRPPPAR